VEPNVPFDKRLKQINRRHEKMGRGVVRSVNSDGLIVARPRAYRPRFPLKGLIVVLAIGFLFKGFLFAFLGEAEYSERVAQLQAGTAMEKAGAWVMQPDPATLAIAGLMQTVLPE